MFLEFELKHFLTRADEGFQICATICLKHEDETEGMISVTGDDENRNQHDVLK